MKTRIKTFKHLTFHRNGIAGEGFYSCLISLNDEKDKTFIVSFKATEDEKYADFNSCRVVCIQYPSMNWRGDNFSDYINDYLNNNPYRGNPQSTLHDWTE